jgi:hypothetical protein
MLVRKSEVRKAPRSNQPPLKAATAPSALPTIQPIKIAGICSTRLHGSAWPTRWFTEAGYCEKEVPRSPWKRLPTKIRNCWKSG